MLRLTLLGDIDLKAPGGASLDAALRRTKRVALLAYLAAARPRGYHRREKIAALFWPELSDERARAALRTTLFRLREDHGVELIRRRGAEELAIHTDQLSCDVAEFDDAMAAEQFETAANLYRGPLLDGVHVEGTAEELESWIESERTRIHSAALLALEHVTTAAGLRGNSAAAIRAAQRAVELAPTDERVVRILILLLLAAGDRGGAMRQYDELVRRLERDLGVAPSADTTELLKASRVIGPLRPAPAAEKSVMSAAGASIAATFAVEQEINTPAKRRTSRRVATVIVAALVLLAGWLGLRTVQESGAGDRAVVVAATAQWHRLRIEGDSQPRLRVHELAFLDSTSNAIIILGGIVSRGESAAGSPVLGDIWRINGLEAAGSHRSTRIVPSRGPAPRARWQAFGAYDTAHDRVIMHGGAFAHSSPCTSDTWILERASGIGGAARWHEVRTTGPLPPVRANAQGFYEPRSRSVVTFAGNDCMSTYLAEVWKLTFDDATPSSGHWTKVSPDSSAGAPNRRNGDAVAYDPRARRMWVHGGNVGDPQEISELWRLDNADGADAPPSWHPVRCASTAPALTSHVAVYDAPNETLILFAGIDETGSPRNDFWYARGLRDGGIHCRWEHGAAPDVVPLPRQTARMMLLPSGAIVMIGGQVEDFGLLDLWRAEFGGTKTP